MKRLAAASAVLLVAGVSLERASADTLGSGGAWNGAYAGVELGGEFAKTNWRTTGYNDSPYSFLALGPDGTQNQSFTGAGLRAGVFAGYNFQFGPWVVGPEASFGFADASKRHQGLPGCQGNVLTNCNTGGDIIPANPTADDYVKVDPTWDANIRGRIGYLVSPDLLLFGTAGLAMQELKVSGGCRAIAYDPVCAGVSMGGTGEVMSQTNTDLVLGWTAGAGVEAKLDDHWHLRGEYRYSGFSSVSGTFFAGSPSGTYTGWDAYHYKVSLETHVATLGLAYQF